MDRILQELYHGMIHPEEEYQPRSEEHCRERKRLADMQEKMIEKIEKIDPNIRREMDELLDEIGMVEALGMEDVYAQGMRMGARLALALLGEKGA